MTNDHASDCATHNAPAYPTRACDCGAEIDAAPTLQDRLEACYSSNPPDWPVALMQEAKEALDAAQAREERLLAGIAALKRPTEEECAGKAHSIISYRNGYQRAISDFNEAYRAALENRK